MGSSASDHDWLAAAKGLGLPISQGKIERVSPILNQLFDECAVVLAEDLSLVEPVGTFRPIDK